MVTTQVTQEARISSRIDANLKRQGEAILAEIGIKPSQAISIFYAQLVRQRGFPFELKVPNKETLEAIEEMRDPVRRAKLPTYKNVADLMKSLDQ